MYITQYIETSNDNQLNNETMFINNNGEVNELSRNECFYNALSDIIVDLLIFISLIPPVFLINLSYGFEYNIPFSLIIVPTIFGFSFLLIFAFYSCHHLYFSKLTIKK